MKFRTIWLSVLFFVTATQAFNDNFENHITILSSLRNTARTRSLGADLREIIQTNRHFELRGMDFSERFEALEENTQRLCFKDASRLSTCMSILEECDVIEPILLSGSIDLFISALVSPLKRHSGAIDESQTIPGTLHDFVKQILRPLQRELLTHFPVGIIKNANFGEDLLRMPNRLSTWIKQAENIAEHLIYFTQLYAQSWEGDIAIWEDFIDSFGLPLLYRYPRHCLSRTHDIINTLLDTSFGDHKNFDRRFLENNPTRASVGAFIQSASAIVKARDFVRDLASGDRLRRMIHYLDYRTDYATVYEVNHFLTIMALATHPDVEKRAPLSREDKLHFATVTADRCLASKTNLMFCMAIAETAPELYEYLSERLIISRFHKTLIPLVNDIAPSNQPMIFEPTHYNYHLTALYLTLKNVFIMPTNDHFLEQWASSDWAPAAANARERFMALAGYEMTAQMWDVAPPTTLIQSIENGYRLNVGHKYDLKKHSMLDYWTRFGEFLQHSRAEWWQQVIAIKNIHDRIESVQIITSANMFKTLRILREDAMTMIGNDHSGYDIPQSVLSNFGREGLLLDGTVSNLQVLYNYLDKRTRKKKGWRNKLGIVSRDRKLLPALPFPKHPDQIAKELHHPQNLKRLTYYMAESQ